MTKIAILKYSKWLLMIFGLIGIVLIMGDLYIKSKIATRISNELSAQKLLDSAILSNVEYERVGVAFKTSTHACIGVRDSYGIENPFCPKPEKFSDLENMMNNLGISRLELAENGIVLFFFGKSYFYAYDSEHDILKKNISISWAKKTLCLNNAWCRLDEGD